MQIDTHSAIAANDFVGADAGGCGNIAAGIGNADISRIVADGVVRAFDGGGSQEIEEFLLWRCEPYRGRGNGL